MEKNIKIDFNYYKTFYFVAKCGNFSMAANQMGVSQPAVSYTISELEKSIGNNLFIRRGKKIELTKTGEILFEYINDCFNTLILAEDKILNINSVEKSQIVFGIQSYLVKTMSQLNTYINQNKDTNIKFVDDTAEGLIKKVQQKEVEVAIVSGKHDFTDLFTEEISCLHMEFIASKNYAMNKISAKDWSSKTFALPLNATNARKELDNILLQNNLRIMPKYEFNSNQICLEFIDQLDAIFYLPREMMENEIDSGKYNILSTNLNLPTIPIYIIYNKKYISEDAQKLINCFKTDLSK